MTPDDAGLDQLILAAAPGQREVLRQALADAVHYRDPPAQCLNCREPDGLCHRCASELRQARAYLALSRALGLEAPG